MTEEWDAVYRSRSLRARVRGAVDRAARLRTEGDEIVRAIAATEDEIALVQELLANWDQDSGDYHRKLASQARRNARRCREQLAGQDEAESGDSRDTTPASGQGGRRGDDPGHTGED